MLRELAYRTRYALSLLEPASVAVRRFACPMCGPSLLLRLSRDSIGVRCVRCGASAITLSLVSVLKSVRPEFARERVYELSSRGPLFAFLKREVGDLIWSEYFDGVPPGEIRDGVQCQDVQRLTFADASFDVCTSTEVFEHVPDDGRGFAEIARVLRPGGLFVFTVPIDPAFSTVERAWVENEEVRHRLPVSYHDDRIRGRGQVLVFREYGGDIVNRLCAHGFTSARIDGRFADAFLGAGTHVVVALR